MTINPANGKRYFVKPLEELESFGEFLSYVQEQEKAPCEGNDEVKYAQTRMSIMTHSICCGEALPQNGRTPDELDIHIRWNQQQLTPTFHQKTTTSETSTQHCMTMSKQTSFGHELHLNKSLTRSTSGLATPAV